MAGNIHRHDWQSVRIALEDLEEQVRRDEPWAERFLIAVREVLDNLPDPEEA